MFAVLGGAPKVVPGLLSPMYLPEGQTRFPDYGALQRQGLPLAPYIEHGSWETGQPSIFRYGRDPYRGILGQDPSPAPIARLDVSERAQRLGPVYATASRVYTILRPLAAAAMAYHGYRRHRGKVLWALGWALVGGAFPLITPAIALAQGFGQPMKERRR